MIFGRAAGRSKHLASMADGRIARACQRSNVSARKAAQRQQNGQLTYDEIKQEKRPAHRYPLMSLSHGRNDKEALSSVQLLFSYLACRRADLVGLLSGAGAAAAKTK
jgi:hypothetical protein